MTNNDWISIKNGREFLNINTGAVLRYSCELDSHSWCWIPAIEHEIAGVTRIIKKFDGIRERKSVWYGSTEDKETAIAIALSGLETFVESIVNVAKGENALPTDDQVHFVAVDESNAERHGWQSLNQKPAYVDGFEDGAKWMRNKKTI